jgi:hypothetical protein
MPIFGNTSRQLWSCGVRAILSSPPAGAEAFQKDLKGVEIHMLDAGHFALETNAAEIAGYIRGFDPLSKVVQDVCNRQLTCGR